MALAKKGLLSKACSALLDEPPFPYSEAVVTKMRCRHRPPRAMGLARLKLLPVAPVSLDTVLPVIHEHNTSKEGSSQAIAT